MFDLILFCVGQKSPSYDFPKHNIYIGYDEKYWEIWKFITEQEGIWYKLYENENEYGGTSICEHLGWDTTLALPGISVDTSDNLTPYKIHERFLESIQTIIAHLLKASPLKMVYILARYQSPDTEVVLGTYSINSFFNLMENDKIYSNVCYIITGYPNSIH